MELCEDIFDQVGQMAFLKNGEDWRMESSSMNAYKYVLDCKRDLILYIRSQDFVVAEILSAVSCFSR